MPVITAIEVQKKNPRRVNIYIDDQFAFGLARIVAAWLKVGQQLTNEKIASLKIEDAREQALQKALHFLGYRARSVNEVRKNLQKHEIPDVVIEDTLIKLQNNGLIGDEDFAKAWVENRSTFRPRGRRALALELRQKGLSDNIIQTTLDETVDEEALALDAARKYARKLEKLERLEFRKKLSGFLARRGFSYEVTSPVTRQVWEELHTGQTTNIENEDLKWTS
jgi:regulatory protein